MVNAKNNMNCVLKKLLFFFFASILLAGAGSVFAADITVPLQIPISGKDAITVCTGDFCAGIADYIAIIYKWAIGLAAVLAVIALTWGGVLWMTAGGGKRTDEAKKVIGNAIAGLLLALCSYLILAAISPQYVLFEPIHIPGIARIDLVLDEMEKTYVAAGSRGVIRIKRTGRPGKKCSANTSTALFRKVYSHPTATALETLFNSKELYKNLRGHAQQIIDLASAHNLDAGIAIGVWRRESGIWTRHGREGAFNLGDMKHFPQKDCRESTIPKCEKEDMSCPMHYCRGPEGSAKTGATMTEVCFQCFNNWDESFQAWFQTIGRYEEGKSIADALETYAPADGNDDTQNGDYQDIVSSEILNVAKASSDAEYNQAKTDLGCR